VADGLLTRALIVALATLGFAIASYFTAVACRWVRPDVGWIPSVCRLGPETCALVVFTPQARVFGLPNSAFGQVYYLALVLAGLGGWVLHHPMRWAFLAASVVTVMLAVYLSHALLVTLRVRCLLCFTSHAINVALLLLLALG